MYWDRFDICEAWYLALVACHGGQYSDSYARLCKLTRPGFFKPSPMLSVDTLNENAREIYKNACTKLLEGSRKKIEEQERIIDDQCDTIIDLVNTLDSRDMQ